MSARTPLLTAATWLCFSLPAAAQEAPDWSQVGALFEERCVMCHSGDTAPLGLQLDSYENARKGSENGPVLIPGDPGGSELVRRIRGESQPRMPFGLDPLAPEEIAMVERWVSAGLPGPEAAAAEPTPEAPAEEQATPGEAAEQSASAGPPAADAPPQQEAAPSADAAAPRASAPADAAAPDVSAAQETALPGPGENVTFADVVPIFARRCVMCHSDAAAAPPPEGLRLDSYENVLRGGERIVIVPGRPDHSELVRRIEGTSQPRMPFNGPPWLSDDEIRLIRQWIEQGALDPAGNKAPMPTGGEVRFRGIFTGEWAMDGAEFEVDGGTRIDDRPTPGQEAEMRGVIATDGSIRATRLRSR